MTHAVTPPALPAGLPAAVYTTYERLLNAPPRVSTNFSTTTAALLAAFGESRLCAGGTLDSLERLGLDFTTAARPVSLPLALKAGVGVHDIVLAAEKTAPQTHLALLMFTTDLAELVLPLFEVRFPADDRPRRAVEALRQYTQGDVTGIDLSSAARAAQSAAYFPTQLMAARIAHYAAATVAGGATLNRSRAAVTLSALNALRLATPGMLGVRPVVAHLLCRYHSE